MALIIAFRNLSDLAPVSDYEVEVLINAQRIYGYSYVVGHRRAEGWQALVRQFAEGLCLPAGITSARSADTPLNLGGPRSSV